MSPANETRPVIVGVDGSDAAIHAVKWAAVEAHARKVPLKLVHVIDTENDFPFVADDLEEEEAFGRDSLASRARGRHRRGLHRRRRGGTAARQSQPRVRRPVGEGEPAGHRLGRSRLLRADGARLDGPITGAPRQVHGRDHPRRRRQPRAAHIRPIIAGVDHSDSADIVVGTAMQEASIRHAELMAIHARRRRGSQEADEEARGRIDRLIATWGAKFPSVSAETVIAKAGPTKHLVSLSASTRAMVVAAAASAASKAPSSARPASRSSTTRSAR